MHVMVNNELVNDVAFVDIYLGWVSLAPTRGI